RPFTGRAGQLLRRLWRTAGYSDLDVALANAVRCRPKSNATPNMSSVRACRPFLLTVVGRLQPQAVVALGGTALRSLTNKADASVTAHRGRLLEVPGLKNREPDG